MSNITATDRERERRRAGKKEERGGTRNKDRDVMRRRRKTPTKSKDEHLIFSSFLPKQQMDKPVTNSVKSSLPFLFLSKMAKHESTTWTHEMNEKGKRSG
jgi:hypothetical protein